MTKSLTEIFIIDKINIMGYWVSWAFVLLREKEKEAVVKKLLLTFTIVTGISLSVFAEWPYVYETEITVWDLSVGDPSNDVSIFFQKFSVVSYSTVILDIMSHEGPNPGTVTDLNGDGEYLYIDSHIYVFRDDGHLDYSDKIAENDDAIIGFPYDTDGSIARLDSYISQFFNAGNYIVAVTTHSGWENMSGSFSDFASGIRVGGYTKGYDAVDGIGAYKGVGSHLTGAAYRDHGDCKLTISGEFVTVIPEPCSILLFVSGLICFIGSRSKIIKR